jgi:hypothetical protein
MPTGQKFGRLTVVEFARRGTYRRMWRCSCSCGEAVVVATSHLRSGHTRSCGCLLTDTLVVRNKSQENRSRVGMRSVKHGLSGSPEYKIYYGARNCCRSTDPAAYAMYGARDIEFRFANVEEFFAALGPRPSSRHSLDRIDNDGHYEPSNVRWATRREQANNTRRNRVVSAFGQSRSVAQWSAETGFRQKLITARLNSGWLPERALSQSVRLQKRKRAA